MLNREKSPGPGILHLLDPSLIGPDGSMWGPGISVRQWVSNQIKIHESVTSRSQTTRRRIKKPTVLKYYIQTQYSTCEYCKHTVFF